MRCLRLLLEAAMLASQRRRNNFRRTECEFWWGVYDQEFK